MRILPILFLASMFAADPPDAGTATQCAELAVLTCGGTPCCVCVTSSGSCSFSCPGKDGSCAPCPECEPDSNDYVAEFIAPGYILVTGLGNGWLIVGFDDKIKVPF